MGLLRRGACWWVFGVQGVIRPGLQRLQELYLAKKRSASEALLGAREKLGAQEEALEERREEHNAAEASVAAMEGRHRAAREGMEHSISSAHAEAERIQAEIEALRAAANNSVAESEEGVSAAKAELEATKQCVATDAAASFPPAACPFSHQHRIPSNAWIVSATFCASVLLSSDTSISIGMLCRSGYEYVCSIHPTS